MNAKNLLNIKFDPDTFAKGFYVKKTSVNNMKRLEEILRKHSIIGQPDTSNIQSIYNQFVKAVSENRINQFESKRNCRKLVWAFPEISKDKRHFDIAIEIIDRNFTSNCLLGIFDGLLRLWNTDKAEFLKSLLRKHLLSYNGKRKFLNILKSKQDYYCDKDSLAKIVVAMQRQKVQLSGVWEWLGLPENMHSYSYFGELGSVFVQLGKFQDKASIEDVIEFLKKHNNEPKIKEIISLLIEKLGINAQESLREPIQDYALQKWFDPRIIGGDIRWKGVSEKARNIFISWLTKEDLVFFFDVVAKACNDYKFEDRKHFWLSYIDHISFCRPILRSNAQNYFVNDPKTIEYIKKRNPAKLLGGTRDQHVFIIQMGNYIFVEFSTCGACYVYHKNSCPFPLNDMQYRIEVFRNFDESYYREIHVRDWESRLSKWIQNELGINSSESWEYYLL